MTVPTQCFSFLEPSWDPEPGQYQGSALTSLSVSVSFLKINDALLCVNAGARLTVPV